MKPKYEKMIDEYVKKHYGDLERGVLAPEVKYKVLTKILKKKLKAAKAQVKILRRLLGHEAPHLCYGCEHYVPMHPDEGLTIIPASCKLGKSMTAYCPFYEEKAQDSYLDWLHDDITWCRRECSNMDCERNTMNRKMTTGLISMADMYDPFKCPVDAELPKNNPS